MSTVSPDRQATVTLEEGVAGEARRASSAEDHEEHMKHLAGGEYSNNLDFICFTLTWS